VKLAVSGGLLAVLLSRVDLPRLWTTARTASPLWLGVALGLYVSMLLVSGWRWGLLLDAQHIAIPFRTLANSLFVALFFNNFLPSNIGGDVVRIRDTARPAGSKTLATTIVVLDRALGLLALVFVAAAGASLAAARSDQLGPIGPGVLWLALLGGLALTMTAVLVPQGVGWLLRPLKLIHQEWVGERILRLTGALMKFREAPAALASCFAGAIVVQAIIVAFYVAVARALGIPIAFAHLAILVPLAAIVQMLPVSINGFGVREATFTFYFARLHLPMESALALSLIATGLIILLSTSGAAAYLMRRETVTLVGQGADERRLGAGARRFGN
jgi:uncharacterized protein (TIRG00374 family)